MDYDITDTIADFVRATNPELVERDKQQSKLLDGLNCINPFYGQWIEMGVEYSLSIFELDDQDLAVRFPELAQQTRPARAQLLLGMKKHFECCPRCELIRKSETDLNSGIEKTLNENRESLLQELSRNRPII